MYVGFSLSVRLYVPRLLTWFCPRKKWVSGFFWKCVHSLFLIWKFCPWKFHLDWLICFTLHTFSVYGLCHFFLKTRDIVLKISKNIQLNIGNVLLNWNHVFFYFDLQYLELCYFSFCKWCWGIQNRFEHQGLVISYLYIIPWKKSLRKVGLPVDWFLRHHMEPFTELSLIFVKKKKHVLRWNGKWKLYIHWTQIEKVGRQWQSYTSIFKPDF